MERADNRQLEELQRQKLGHALISGSWVSNETLEKEERISRLTRR